MLVEGIPWNTMNTQTTPKATKTPKSKGKGRVSIDLLKRESNKALEAKREELQQHESIQFYLERRKTRAKTKFTEEHVRYALNGLIPFFKFANKDPDTLVTEAQEDIAGTESLLKSYFEELKEHGISHNSARAKAYLAQGFFSRNRIKGFDFKIAESKTSEIHEEDAKEKFFVRKNGKWRRNGRLMSYMSALGLKFRIVNISSLSSGMDVQDVLKLKVGQFLDATNHITEELRINVKSNRTKNNELFNTYLSREATKFIKDLIKQDFGRGELSAHKDTFVFRDHNNEQLELVAIQQANQRASEKLGIKTPKGKQHVYRPKRMRRAFITACNRAKVPKAIGSMMTGHSKDVHDTYDNVDILEYYLDVEPLVTVYGYDSERTDELKEELNITNRDLEVTKKMQEEQKVETKALKERMSKIEQEKYKEIVATIMEDDKLLSLLAKKLKEKEA